MNHLGLFAGIGGFELAARMVGWTTVGWCEINKRCQKILTKHFPNANRHGAIEELDGTQYRGTVDIITGGFPCQPYSVSGKRRGKYDARHLWPENRRIVREITPRWVVGENVHGLTHWNGGLVFDEIQADLEDEGYEVTPYILPACGVGAWHRRERVWFVAHRSDILLTNKLEPGSTSSEALTGEGEREKREWFRAESGAGYEEFPTAAGWGSEPRVDRMVYGVPDRMDRIAELGNAIVPQVAIQIFKAINEYDKRRNH